MYSKTSTKMLNSVAAALSIVIIDSVQNIKYLYFELSNFYHIYIKHILKSRKITYLQIFQN